MDIQFDIYVVVQEKRIPENICVTTVFNEALRKFIENEYCYIEFWKEGKKTRVCRNVDDLVAAGVVKQFLKSDQ